MVVFVAVTGSRSLEDVLSDMVMTGGIVTLPGAVTRDERFVDNTLEAGRGRLPLRCWSHSLLARHRTKRHVRSAFTMTTDAWRDFIDTLSKACGVLELPPPKGSAMEAALFSAALREPWFITHPAWRRLWETYPWPLVAVVDTVSVAPVYRSAAWAILSERSALLVPTYKRDYERATDYLRSMQDAFVRQDARYGDALGHVAYREVIRLAGMQVIAGEAGGMVASELFPKIRLAVKDALKAQNLSQGQRDAERVKNGQAPRVPAGATEQRDSLYWDLPKPKPVPISTFEDQLHCEEQKRCRQDAVEWWERHVRSIVSERDVILLARSATPLRDRRHADAVVPLTSAERQRLKRARGRIEESFKDPDVRRHLQHHWPYLRIKLKWSLLAELYPEPYEEAFGDVTKQTQLVPYIHRRSTDFWSPGRAEAA